MIKKIFIIFLRDMKMSVRNFITLYILVVPIVMAILINIFAPGISDTTVEVLLLEGENHQQIEYFEKFATVETLTSLEEIENRLSKRDNIIAILMNSSGENYIMTEGNEPDYVVDFVKRLAAFEQFDIGLEDSTAEILDYGYLIPPLKKLMVNAIMLFTSILGGMIIALNIVEEKTDNTISAINLTPVSRLAFIAGKSMIGVVVPVVVSIIMLVVTGFTDVNFFHVFLMVISSCVMSVLIGFIEGINNDDVMSAAGNMKMLFLPLAASIAAVELLADKWQPFFYWIPFYWTYKGNDLVLSNKGSMLEILTYSGIVLAISSVVFIVLAPKIRKGLEKV